MSILRGKAPYRDHLLCRTGEDLDGLLDEHREAAEALIASSEWPGFDHVVVACVDEREDELVGVTSAWGDDLLFLVVEDRQGEGLGQLMAEALSEGLPEDLTEEEAASDDYQAPWSAIAGSEAGASLLASLPNKLGWKAYALIEWSGYDEEKEMWREYLEEASSGPRDLPPLRNDDRVSEILVYRWQDGSQAVLQLEAGEVMLEVRWVHLPRTWIDPTTGKDTFPAFSVDSPTETGGHRHLTLSNSRRFPEELERKVLGLLLDLGVERPYNQPSLVNHQWGVHAVGRYPRFVSDERWAGRYEEAKRSYQHQERDRLLGLVVGFQLHRGHLQVISSLYGPAVRNRVDEGGWTAEWSGTGAQVCSTFSRDLVEAVDEVLQSELVLPESQLESWEKEHVERGELVAPAPEEMVVYNLLGEECPIWWEFGRLLAWAKERRS